MENKSINSGSSLAVIPLEKLMAEIDQATGSDESSSGLGSAAGDKALPKTELLRFKEQYIRFYLDDILLAIPLSSALEIGQRPIITPLPNLPEWILGVSNIRGEIISIVDLKAFFGLGSQHVNRDRRFITVRNKEMKVGLVVDRILGIYSPNQSEVQLQDSPYKAGDLSMYIVGIMIVDDQLLNILDVDHLLTSPRMNAFRTE